MNKSQIRRAIRRALVVAGALAASPAPVKAADEYGWLQKTSCKDLLAGARCRCTHQNG